MDDAAARKQKLLALRKAKEEKDAKAAKRKKVEDGEEEEEEEEEKPVLKLRNYRPKDEELALSDDARATLQALKENLDKGLIDEKE